MQANDYYPFGMSYTPRQTVMQDSNWENKYKYNGKEEQEVPGGWLDFHARFYDPAIVRTTTQDPHAENYYSESSYSFMGNNPIINIDPTGMDWFYYKKKHGNDATYHWHDGSTHALSFTYIDSDGNEQNENIELQGTKSAIVDEIKKNPGEPNSGNNDEELAEIETNGEVSENPAKKVYEGGMAIALTLSLADGPQPGPGDAAGISYAASTIVTAGLVWLGWEIYQFAEHSSNKRKSTWNKHSKTRPGQQQGKARNAKRGEKNKKHQKKDNPNK
jgi:RHS repeat-associated protein